ncbi:MFS transporter [Streptomyces sp. NPDC002734]|uniref:MFS transporter n=1 Tax=Streptomyces sp. NPDC002734 TaxID=3154426 RepID=UPI0033332555
MSASVSRPSYVSVLREPHMARVFAAALVGRFSYGVLFVALMVTLTRAAGSYAWAGTAIALFGLATVFLAPVRAGLVDRFGRRRVLLPMAAVYSALLGCLSLTAWRPGAPQWALLALTLSAGACAPPLGPVMRALWSETFAKRPELRQRAFSLDTVCEELLYVLGPLVAGLFIVLGNAAAGVAASAVLVLGGTAAMVLGPAVDRPDDGPTGRAAAAAGQVRASVPRDPVVVAAAVGFTLGALNLLVVASAEHHGRLAAVSWLEAATAVGSTVGGIVYGARTWRLPGRARLPLFALALAVSLALAGLAPGLLALTAGVALVGLCVSPALATAYLAADESADPAGRVRAGAWVNSACNAGSSCGAAGVGLLLGGFPLRVCFALAALPALTAALAALPGLRRPAVSAPSPDRAGEPGPVARGA